ncbi:hypothetical protein IL306_004454 [Fusarium sp. DS 682]|nr:hypothetical protein IL306_004454 [Fusarium sp. DS 682]
MVAWTITIAFLNSLICVPVAKFWDSTLPGHCIDPLTVCTCAISIIRIRTLKTAASTNDPNWDNVDAAIWSFLEVTLAIITSCLPTLRPLFSKFMPKLFASSFGRSNGPSEYGYARTRSSQNLRSMPRFRTEDTSKDSIDDTTTLRKDEVPLPPISRRRYSRGFAGVSVSIQAEGQKHSSETETQSPLEPSSPSHGGIKATTVVTQEIVVERRPDDEWSHGRHSDSDATLRE